MQNTASFSVYKTLQQLYQENFLPQKLLQNSPTTEKNLEDFFHLLCTKAVTKKFIGKANEETLFFRHIVDSLLILNNEKIFSVLQNSSIIIDLGAGAGLPSIPLSMLLKDKLFYLVDNDRHRIEFCFQAKKEYSLKNIFPLYSNVQTITKEKLHLKDTPNKNITILFRAFRRPLISLELALFSFLALQKNKNHSPIENFHVLYYRSHPIDFSAEAQKHLQDLGYGNLAFYRLATPAPLPQRGMYVFHKNLPTANGFPRTFKKIKQDPLPNIVL